MRVFVFCSVWIPAAACEKVTSDLGLSDSFCLVLRIPPPLRTVWTRFLLFCLIMAEKVEDYRNAEFCQNPSRRRAIFFHPINARTIMPQYDREIEEKHVLSGQGML